MRRTKSICSSVAVTDRGPSVRGHEHRPELAADAALAQPDEVGLRRLLAHVHRVGVQVVGGVLAHRPGEVVVPVEHGMTLEQLARGEAQPAAFTRPASRPASRWWYSLPCSPPMRPTWLSTSPRPGGVSSASWMPTTRGARTETTKSMTSAVLDHGAWTGASSSGTSTAGTINASPGWNTCSSTR